MSLISMISNAYDLIKDIVAQKLPDIQHAGSCHQGSAWRRYNNKCYRVDDIDWSMTPSSKFTDHIGKEKSFMDYYKKQYNITIKDPKQPMSYQQDQEKDS